MCKDIQYCKYTVQCFVQHVVVGGETVIRLPLVMEGNSEIEDEALAEEESDQNPAETYGSDLESEGIQELLLH